MNDLLLRLRDLSDRAGLLAKSLEADRIKAVLAPNAASMVALAQVGAACRDFHNAIESGFSALPQLREGLP
jgi:hypothetical protein